VKIAPQFFSAAHPVIHVLDASRSVVVVSNLLDTAHGGERRGEYVREIEELYAEMREEHYAGLEDRRFLALAAARAKGPRFDWAAHAARATVPGALPWAPRTLGPRTLRPAIVDLIPFIDWNPFFSTWELRGKYPNRGYPKIFDDADVGSEARKLHADAVAMLKEACAGSWLEARGVAGVFPASSTGEDVRVWAPADDARRADAAPIATFCMMRQQAEKETDEPYLSLADYIAPEASGLRDAIGGFAVAIFGGEAAYARFAAAHDDYSKIMLQALSDRLAEAFAEWAHWRMRVDFWGYAPEESLSTEDLLKVKYEGIRPAPGCECRRRCPSSTQELDAWGRAWDGPRDPAA
jgi:5-methyltetrahydrofolate--homocysteine methyltransferase